MDGTDLKHVIVTDLPEPLGFPFNRLVEKKVRKAGMMVDVPDGPGIWSFDNLIKTSAPNPPTIDVSPDDVVLFQYTGGTTGSPKAAMLTHRNVMCNVQADKRPGTEICSTAAKRYWGRFPSSMYTA